MYYIRFRFTAIVVIPLAGRFDILSGYYMFLNWDLFFSHCQVQNINYLSLLINISLPFVSKCVLVFFNSRNRNPFTYEKSLLASE